MTQERLTPLDASFLDVETSSAHMHVGWAAVFDPPERGASPSFEQLRDHIGRRLRRAPRYRQRLTTVPLGAGRPVWTDDERFDIGRHVRCADSSDLGSVVDSAMSTPLGREHPLWELWIADRLPDGRLGIAGKAHHCMVDGIAAVELAALLLDVEPSTTPDPPDEWQPRPAPGRASLLAGAVADMAGSSLELAQSGVRTALSPRRGLRVAWGAARALAHTLAPAPNVPLLNEPISPYRHLATLARSLDDFRRVRHAFGTTVNDVLLAVAAGGVRRYLERRGEQPVPIKTMVPVNLRGDEGGVGNRITFLFLELRCDEPDPVRRLEAIHRATSERKEAAEPEGAEAVLRLVSAGPQVVQRAFSRLAASPLAFNVVVSNIPGPPETLYMLGCPLREAYPVVPLADRHAVSIGFTTVAGGAYFGLYADRDALPDADALAADLDASLNELLERSGAAAPKQPEPVHAG
ncbi:MAG: wax ester/triacylglycerol synthase family O-acyltransferase [Thermoleophilaceae bacterium]